MTTAEITLFEEVLDKLGIEIISSDDGFYTLKTRKYGNKFEIQINGFNFNTCLFHLVNNPALEDLRY